MNRLLLIDDDSSLCELASLALGRTGFDVRTCRTAAKAREIIDEEAIDVVITDVTLDDGDAFQLIDDLRARSPELPIVVLSGHPGYEGRSRELGAAAFLLKPTSLDELARAANEAVAAMP